MAPYQMTVQGYKDAIEQLRGFETSRTRMLSAITHDISGPLTAVTTFVAMIRARMERPPDEIVRAFDVLHQSLDQLVRLLDDLRVLATADAGTFRVAPEDKDVSHLIENVVGSLAVRAEEEGVTLGVHGVETAHHAWIDPDRLHQVTYNLAHNAIKFTPPGGRIDVYVTDEADGVMVSVVDTGRGLTADERREVFKPFRQVHDPAEYGHKGSGLGLYICKTIVEAHKGWIVAESEGHGKGATVRFWVPSKDA